jgi:hypothetical protein
MSVDAALRRVVVHRAIMEEHMSSFRLTGIAHEPFEPLFHDDAQLAEIGGVRLVATEAFGFPCRISLDDAVVGDELLLLPYVHLPAASPYRSSGPIFVRRGVQRRTLEPGEVPPYVTRRLISVRAYDVDHMMIDAGVCDGTLVAEDIAQRFDDDRVAFIHLHNAKRGCFSCRVDRV